MCGFCVLTKTYHLIASKCDCWPAAHQALPTLQRVHRTLSFAWYATHQKVCQLNWATNANHSSSSSRTHKRGLQTTCCGLQLSCSSRGATVNCPDVPWAIPTKIMKQQLLARYRFISVFCIAAACVTTSLTGPVSLAETHYNCKLGNLVPISTCPLVPYLRICFHDACSATSFTAKELARKESH